MKINALKNKKGFSLLELLLVMGIIAALIVGAFVVYPKVRASNNAATESKNIALIQSSARSLYAAKGNYNGLYTTVLTKADLIPKSMINKNGYPVNSFGGVITVMAEAINGRVDTGFMISSSGFPPAECIKIISSVASNFYMVRVNSSNYVKQAGKKLDMEEAVKQCSAKESNSIELDSE